MPTQIGLMSNLKELDLYYSTLKGFIPFQLGKLTNLDLLDLEMTNLTGLIPTQIGKLTKLTHLNLGENDFEGPSSVSNLTSDKLGASHF